MYIQNVPNWPAVPTSQAVVLHPRKDRRRYAAVEAEKLGHGGVQYIADLFGCDPQTIHHGAQDMEQLPADEAEGRVRKKGGPQAS